MKSLKTILLILLTQTVLQSQEFAPIGAIWHVQVAEPFSPDWAGTLTNESIRDTSLKGMSCKIIFKSQPTIFNEIFGEYILCQEGDSIFHYIESLDSMNLVMNFDADIGESWESFDRANEYESFGNERNYLYMVDSISYIYFDDQDSLKVQHLTVLEKDWSQPYSEYNWNWQTDELIERIGFKSALLPKNVGDGLTDDLYETDVRCYQDDEIGLINLTEDESCIKTSTTELTGTNFYLYPNPTNGYTKLGGLENHKRLKLILTDVSGKRILALENPNQIDLTSLERGLYFLQIFDDELLATKKIVLLK